MSEGSWTHAMCLDCWKLRNGERTWHALRNGDPEPCCYCDRETTDGIYTRDDPASIHPAEPEDGS